MQRADRNHWGIIALICFASYVLALCAFALANAVRPNDALSAIVFYGSVLAASAGVFLGARRATRMRRWWAIPLLLSPLTIVLVFMLVANLGLVFSPTPGSGDGAGIGYFKADRPGNMNYVSDYEYAATWDTVSFDSGSMQVTRDRDVWIRVEDAKGNRLLDDKLELNVGGIIGRAQWSRFESLEITLFEGDPYASDDLNRSPDSAARILILTYRFDSAARRFKRVGLRVLRPDVMRARQ